MNVSGISSSALNFSGVQGVIRRSPGDGKIPIDIKDDRTLRVRNGYKDGSNGSNDSIVVDVVDPTSHNVTTLANIKPTDIVAIDKVDGASTINYSVSRDMAHIGEMSGNSKLRLGPNSYASIRQVGCDVKIDPDIKGYQLKIGRDERVGKSLCLDC